ncbi:MAG: coniferyl aldehyde dehydrogenase [Hyphomicrobiaceae bacterium]|nr:coniferyl aldehyde dehydrogenase [Hyphomicrobiaceae bacterium]
MALDTDTPFSELEQRFEAMYRASRSMPPWTLGERTGVLRTLQQVIAVSRDEFAAAISADFGTRAAEETLMAEVVPALTLIAHTVRQLGTWMAPERRSTAISFWMGYNRIYYQPKGVVLIIAPWNYPLQLAVIPLAAALAAGNRVILKPSELTPHTSALLKLRLEEAFGADVVTVATGGADIAAGLSSLPFDHILFTGSTGVGAKVMAAAAQNLTPVTLELGGKSPAIVHEGADMTTAAARIARGKLLNAGQTCIAPDYALVPRARVGDFVVDYGAAAARFYPRVIDNPQYTSIVSERHFERLAGLLREARNHGAKASIVDPAGELPSSEAASSNTRKIAPVVLTDVTDDMGIMQEEIFGPILPVVAYDTLDEAIAYVNGRPRPLALYYFDTDKDRIAHVLARTTSGGATVNDTLLHVAQEDLPFGGVGPSGMGAYHGREGFLTFSHAKAVFHQGRFTLTDLVNPPYGGRFQSIMKAALARAGAGRRKPRAP